MANPDRANGFTPVKSLWGAPWTALIRRIQMADASADTSNNHGDIYIGDPIKYSSGKALAANSGDSILGVCVGVGRVVGDAQNESGMFDPADLERRYADHTLSDTDTIYIYFVPSEGVLFEVQSASDLGNDNPLDAEFDFSTDANESHGSRTTSLSSAELVGNANSDVVVVEIPEYPDNDITLTNARYWVRFRNTEHVAPMPTS